MPVVKVDEHKRNYTILLNEIFNEKELSFKAKGLLCFAMSVSENWRFSKKGLCKISNDKDASVESALRELEKHFYLTREKVREKGKFNTVYTFYETPNLNPTITEKTVRLKTRGTQTAGGKRS